MTIRIGENEKRESRVGSSWGELHYPAGRNGFSISLVSTPPSPPTSCISSVSTHPTPFLQGQWGAGGVAKLIQPAFCTCNAVYADSLQIIIKVKIKMRSYWIRGVLNPMRLIYKGQKRIHRDIGKKASEDKGRDLSDTVTNRWSPGAARS